MGSTTTITKSTTTTTKQQKICLCYFSPNFGQTLSNINNRNYNNNNYKNKNKKSTTTTTTTHTITKQQQISANNDWKENFDRQEDSSLQLECFDYKLSKN